jgi:divalent metal cation (Fe/Co/Zn/Cd) transporter
MLDGIEPEILAQIEHAPFHVEVVAEVHAVRARWAGHHVHADLHITVDPRLSVAEAHEIAHRVERSLVEHVPTLSDGQATSARARQTSWAVLRQAPRRPPLAPDARRL